MVWFGLSVALQPTFGGWHLAGCPAWISPWQCLHCILCLESLLPKACSSISRDFRVTSQLSQVGSGGLLAWSVVPPKTTKSWSSAATSKAFRSPSRGPQILLLKPLLCSLTTSLLQNLLLLHLLIVLPLLLRLTALLTWSLHPTLRLLERRWKEPLWAALRLGFLTLLDLLVRTCLVLDVFNVRGGLDSGPELCIRERFGHRLRRRLGALTT